MEHQTGPVAAPSVADQVRAYIAKSEPMLHRYSKPDLVEFGRASLDIMAAAAVFMDGMSEALQRKMTAERASKRRLEAAERLCATYYRDCTEKEIIALVRAWEETL